MRRTRRPGYVLALGISITMLLLLTVACSSSSGSSASSGGTSSQSAASTAGLAQAQAMVAKYSTRPTAIPINTPLKAKVPTGKSLLFISCGVSACTLEASIIKGVTDKLGWSFSTIATSGTPQSIKAAWDTAVREKPNAVMYTGTDDTYFASELATLRANGTVVSDCCVTGTPPTNFNTNTVAQNEPVGALFADWVTAQSGGSAKVLMVTVSAYPTLVGYVQGYNAEIAKVCPKCTTHLLDISYPDVSAGNSPNDIVSYLRANPSTKYVVLNLDSSVGVGLPAAIAAAGLTGIKTIGTGPDSTILQYVKDGQQDATIPFPYYEELGGAMIDGLLRAMTNQPAINGTTLSLPLWIVTKNNIPSTQIFPIVANSQQQFYKLWGVG
jgi:ribose transport system substrate-binding protein